MVPRVSDFGLAVVDDRDHLATSLAGPRGTPAYMAPEQTTGTQSAIGPTADIYALGAILYELLTSRPPFQGPSSIETLDQVRSRNPISPRRLNPSIPRDLETVCLRCIEKDPSGRYPSADAVAEELRRWLEGARRLGAAGLDRRNRVAMVSPATRRGGPAREPGDDVVRRIPGDFRAVALRRSETGQQELDKSTAEANYAVARAALGEVLGLGAVSLSSQVIVSRDQAIGSLKVARLRSRSS